MNVAIDDLVEILQASVDFCHLDIGILTDLAESLDIVTAKGGQVILKEGESSDSMFFLIKGRLRVSRLDPQGQRLLYNEVLPGDCVGETGLILRQARTADITALRDSVLAMLTAQKFEVLIAKHSVELNRAFSLAIYRHLRHDRRIAERKRAQSFFLIPIHPSINVELFAQNLKKALSENGQAEIILTDHEVSSAHLKHISTIDLDREEADNDFLIFQSDMAPIDNVEYVLRHADQVIFIADGLQSSELSEVETGLAGIQGYDLIRKHLALVFPESATACGDRIEWAKHRQVERVYPIKLDSLSDFASLGRFLLGKAIGVVLGGGGARGFAHLGVIKAFEEANIPLDIIGGNSMGALIGACYVSGIPREEIHKRILSYSKGGMKPTLPLVSLMSNTSLEQAFKEALGETNIQNLWKPYFAAACNLTTAGTAIIADGPLWRAVLASNSPAGLFPPVVVKGQLLVDGAILENVPVQAMRQRLSTPLERRRGNGAVIAIDVDIKEPFSVHEEVTSLSAWNKLKSHLASNQPVLPGIVDILMQVAHIGGLAQRQSTKFAADVYFEPPLSQFKMMDYKRAEQIIDVGYEYAVKQIQQILEVKSIN